MTIVKREGLGRPMTWGELDGNFADVEALRTESAQAVAQSGANANASAASAGVAETARDKALEAAVQVENDLVRVIKAPEGEVLGELPVMDDRRDTLLGFGSNGQPVVRTTDDVLTDVIKGFNFESGAILESINDHVYDPNSEVWWFWGRDYPKTVSPGDSPGDGFIPVGFVPDSIILPSLESLRHTNVSPKVRAVYVISHSAGGTSGGGVFVANDLTPGDIDDDGYTVLSSNTKWVRDNVYTLNWEMFGADISGVRDSASALYSCVNAANRLRLPIRQCRGVFRIASGTDDLTLTTDTDLSGSVILPDGWAGRIVITRLDTWIDYLPGTPEFDALTTNNHRLAGDSKVDGWATANLLPGCYVKFGTNQPMYRYRGNVINRSEHNVVFSNGQLSSPFLYSFPSSSVFTYLTSLKLAETFLEIKGISIDESLYTNTNHITINNASKVNLINTSFVNRGQYKPINITRLLVKDSAYVNVSSVDCTDVNATPDNTYTYTMTLQDSYEVVIDGLRSDGSGWGSTGSNRCQRVTFKNSRMSRVDFHEPCKEFLNVEDSVLGNWGVLVTSLGDVNIRRTNWLQRDGYNNSGFVRTRSDMGGFCDGNLNIEDCTINGRAPNAATLMNRGLVNCQMDATQGYVEGSPISFTCFNEINIDGLTYIPSDLSSSITILQSGGNSIMMPKEINISNFNADYATVKFDFTYFKSRLDNAALPRIGTPCSPQISLTNVTGGTFNFVGSGTKHLPSVTMNNIHNAGDNSSLGALLEPVFKGRYNVINSQLLRVKTYSGGWPQYPVSVNVSGGTLGSMTESPIDADARQNIILNNVDILFPTNLRSATATNQLITRSAFENCRFYDGVTDTPTRRLVISDDATANTRTFDITLNARNRQQLVITTGDDSTNSYMVHKIPLEMNTGGYAVAIRQTTNGTLRVVLSPGTTGNIAIACTVTPNEGSTSVNVDNIRTSYIESL